MRIKGFTRIFSGLHVSYVPGRAQLNVGEASPAMTGDVAVTSSASVLVADEVLHPIGKIQPLLIGWNLP